MNQDGIDAQTAVTRLATRCGLLQLELDLAREEVAALRQQLADLTGQSAEDPAGDAAATREASS